MISRRNLLRNLMLTSGYCLLPIGGRGWTHGWAMAAPENTNSHMVVIMMRGAVDGLSIVAPYREQNYYNARPNIAIAAPGQNDGLLNLDGFFGLHPSLASLMPLWQNKTLAFVQASGSPAETRSHFEAQDIMETAMLNSALASQGWMNGLAQMLPDNRAPTRALSFGDKLPKIFQGRFDVSTVPVGMRGNANYKVENPALEKQFAQMYGDNTPLGGLYKQALSAHDQEMQDLQPDMMREMQTAGQNAPNTDAFVAEATRVGGMIRSDPKIQLVFMDVGGWDTHVGQGNAKGQLANRLEKLGNGLMALAQNLGDEYRNTTVLVMSEFGRTVAQNGNNGTDHGHGNVAWVMGGTVNGGRVYGQWPGLSPNQLWEGRDLAVTTDFRSIIGMVVAGQFGLGDDAIRQIIPDYKPDREISRLIT